MGLTRCRLYKQRLTGGERHVHRKKRAFEVARPAAGTKLTPTENRVRVVRTRGGNTKKRALRLANGNFAWGSAGSTNKCRIIDVVYNATSNELVRTKTLVHGCIVQVDATPFKHWFYRRFGVLLGKKKASIKQQQQQADGKKKKNLTVPLKETAAQKKNHLGTFRYGKEIKEIKNPSKYILKKWAARRSDVDVEKSLESQFRAGRLLAKITSRPGQVGRADGKILEGKELEFYAKKLDKKKKKQ